MKANYIFIAGIILLIASISFKTGTAYFEFWDTYFSIDRAQLISIPGIILCVIAIVIKVKAKRNLIK